MTENKKYTNGKIYKIIDIGYNKCYIGSTTQPLSARMAGHRRQYKRYLESKCHLISCFLLFQEFGLDNCKIELIEEYPCDNLEQLLKKEGEHIKSVDCVNRCVAGRKRLEYYEQHKDKIKEYREQNKEHKKEYNQKYYEQNQEKIKEGQKDYRKQNQEKFREREKEYRKQNQDKIKALRKERIECPFCSARIVKGQMRRHQLTQKCLERRKTESEEQN